MLGVPIHNAACYGALAFLLGIAAASAGISLGVSAAVLAVFCAGAAGARRHARFDISAAALVGLLSIAAAGFLYFHLAATVREPRIPAGASFEGLVSRDPKRGDRQELTLSLRAPANGTVVFYAPRYPAYAYGDILKFGPDAEVGKRYGRQVIRGAAAKMAERQGNRLRAALYGAKRIFVAELDAALPRERAALLAGLTVGERGELSRELKEALSASGTTHIVALSGYNIAILALAAGALLSKFLSHRPRFLSTLGFIAAFVIATGAEASVVRAGVMGAILLLAKESGRTYSLRNAIVLAALVMALLDPSVLMFDLGFQLSFLALLGIVFLLPRLTPLFERARVIPGLLREHLATTAAAQLAVTPLLLSSFGSFSMFALPANVLILGTIPLTMALGLLAGFAGILSNALAGMLAIPADALLSYQIGIITFFGRRLPQTEIAFAPSWLLVLAYYGLLLWWVRHKSSHSHAASS